MSERVLVCDTVPNLRAALAAAWRDSAEAAVGRCLRFLAALSGGGTPGDFYRHLAAQPGLPWERTQLFEVDERMVALNSPESNQRLIRATLLDGLPTAPGGAHFVSTEAGDETAAAADYERRLREFLTVGGAKCGVFDLVLLGIGEDGHTASLFPGDAALEERSRLVAGVAAAPARRARVTLTLPAINAARRVIMIVTGAKKRTVLERVLRADQRLPAARVRCAGGPVEVFADSEAFPGR